VTATPADSNSVGLSRTHDPAAAVVEYRVARDGAEVGVVAAPGSSYHDTGLAAATTYQYAVTAVDKYGQRSTPGAGTATTPAAAEAGTVDLIASGAAWKWHYDATAWPADWRQGSFDDSAWASGAAVLGWNTPGLATDISIGAPSVKPLAAQFRNTFTVSDPGAFASATVSVLANDGVAVYLNGTELGRANLPTGTLSQGTYANAAPRSSVAAANRVTFDVPVGLLVSGANVLSAETHLNYKSTPDISFDLTLTGTR
jgi:hypothetical protein